MPCEEPTKSRGRGGWCLNKSHFYRKVGIQVGKWDCQLKSATSAVWISSSLERLPTRFFRRRKNYEWPELAVPVAAQIFFHTRIGVRKSRRVRRSLKHPIRRLQKSRLKIYNRLSNDLERLGHEKLLDLRAAITAELRRRYEQKAIRKESWESRVIVPRITVQLARRAREREISHQTF